MLTSHTTNEARIAIEPGFSWDTQDAYLFDIDGTLLRSRDRVHVDSFASSVHRVTGFEITLAGILLHGSTDTAILREACNQAGVPSEILEARIEAILEAMRHAVAERRHELDVVRMPGVEKTLRQWFRFGGFSDHFPIRAELIGQAADKARELAGKGASICVVGDTPRDIEAARANFLSVIAVATGRYSFDELMEHQPEVCATSLADLLAYQRTSR